MKTLISDLIDLTEGNYQGGSRESERSTIEVIRMQIQRAGGTIVLESHDWGHDRAILFDAGEWTGPEDSVSHPYCALQWCMDGYVASFAGPLSMEDAFAQWCEYTRAEIMP